MGPLHSGGGRLERDRLFAGTGAGPLLQRDYWAIIDRCELGPAEIAGLVATRFCAFAPPELARFTRMDGSEGALEVGDDLQVTIRLVGTFAVRVIHMNQNSITLGTLRGHPEAGRITFGAYRNDQGEVIFHIRSRARSSTAARHAGFWALGQSMQASVWTHFVEEVARAAGGGVAGLVFEETRKVTDEDEDAASQPTYLAVGD